VPLLDRALIVDAGVGSSATDFVSGRSHNAARFIDVGLLHGTGTGAGTGTETADELTRVNNYRPSIFLASPSRSTWLLAVQFGWPVAVFNDTSK
jgi:hypothetical protein